MSYILFWKPRASKIVFYFIYAQFKTVLKIQKYIYIFFYINLSQEPAFRDILVMETYASTFVHKGGTALTPP